MPRLSYSISEMTQSVLSTEIFLSRRAQATNFSGNVIQFFVVDCDLLIHIHRHSAQFTDDARDVLQILLHLCLPVVIQDAEFESEEEYIADF